MRKLILAAVASACLLCAQTVSQPVSGSSGPGPGVFAATLRSDLASTTTTGVVRIAVPGDSLSHCNLAACGGSFPTSNWVDLMKSYLQGKYGNHGTGIVPFRADVSTTATNPLGVASTTGTISSCTSHTPEQASQSGSAGANGPGQGCTTLQSYPATLTGVANTFDHLTLLYLGYNQGTSGDGTAVGMDVKIDSNDLGTCCTANTSSVVPEITTLAAPGGSGSHNFTLTLNNGTVPIAYLLGYEGVNGTTGVSIDNLSTSGARSEYYSILNGSGGALSAFYQIWTANAAHTYFMLMTGTNDFTFATVQQHGGYLGSTISDLMSNGISASHILIISPPFENPLNTLNTTANDQAAYKAVEKQVASVYGVSYLDVCTLNSVFCNYNTQNTASYMLSDGLHMNQSGQTAWWNAIKSALGL